MSTVTHTAHVVVGRSSAFSLARNRNTVDYYHVVFFTIPLFYLPLLLLFASLARAPQPSGRVQERKEEEKEDGRGRQRWPANPGPLRVLA
jgi:hypothetical protein